MNLPESKEAEEAVLGCCLIAPPAIDDVAQIIRDDRAWFYPTHLDLWKILKSFRETNKSIDGMLIQEEIKKAGKFETFGGYEWLAKLVNTVASTNRVKDYCGIVWDHWIRRLAIADASRTMQSAGETEAKAGDVVAMVTRQAQELSEAAAPPNRETKESLIDAVVADWMDPPPGWAGVPSGLFVIDNVIGGFRKGQLIIVGARPSCGKSAITLGFALHAALVENLNVLFLTLEMTPKETMARAIAMVSGVQMNRPNDNPRAIAAVKQAAKDIQRSSLTILGGHAYDAEMCCAVIRREHARKPLDLVVVDHLHHMKHKESFRGEGGVEAIGHSTLMFKNSALQLDLPIILPAQLNRGPADRADQRPNMSDLRASGKIEEHADIVMLLSPNFTEEPKPKAPSSTIFPENKRRSKQTIIDGLVQIEIAKNRNGPTDDVTVQFCAGVTKFTNQQIGGTQEWV